MVSLSSDLADKQMFVYFVGLLLIIKQNQSCDKTDSEINIRGSTAIISLEGSVEEQY